MNDYRGLPWAKINDYLLEIGTSRKIDDLLRRAVVQLGRIIPYDSAAGVFDVDRKVLYSDGMSQSAQEAYNLHFRHVREPFCLKEGPAFPDPAFFTLRVGRYSDYAESEFYMDFARPNQLEYRASAAAPGCQIILSPNRSRRGPAFTDRDVKTLEVITAHLNNFYSILKKLGTSTIIMPEREDLAERFPALSRREVEIGHYLCGALSVPEIASRLMISARTVEAHVAHLYVKLNVRSRRAAVALLTASRSEDR